MTMVLIIMLSHLAVGVYVDDIPMRLAERYRPLDVSAFTEQQTVIPDPFDQHVRY